jgi:hypothetical protein
MRTDEQRQFADQAVGQSTFTAEELADDIVRAVAKKRFYVVKGRRAHWIWRLKRFCPRLFMWEIARRYRRR